MLARESQSSAPRAVPRLAQISTHLTSARPIVMVPGPVEFSPAVLAAMATPAQAHTADFVPVFQQTLGRLREVLGAAHPAAQPYVVAGSGTLGWDMVGANLVAPGLRVLAVVTGFFGHGFVACLQLYGVEVEVLEAAPGDAIRPETLREALRGNNYAAVTITHVDTSTGVLNDLKALAHVVSTTSPSSLIVVDGVCSVGVEPLEFDAWKLDFVLTASQKGLGTPSGLLVACASERAVAIALARPATPGFMASLKRWTPIMRAYEAGTPAYFATPPVQTIHALNTSLGEMVAEGRLRYAKHAYVARRVAEQLAAAGFRPVSSAPAHGMTAVIPPAGMTPAEVIGAARTAGYVITGGLLPSVNNGAYVRIGHMGQLLAHAEALTQALVSASARRTQ